MPNTANAGPTPVKSSGAVGVQQVPGQSDSVQSKRDLASWWKQFKRSDKKPSEVEAAPVQGIFGVPLQTSIRYANVAISLFNDDGQGYIYGYVPIVVAKCGVFLKEKATDVEGIFRLAGSEKRIKELKVAFDSPDRYGKGLDWTGYTVHDAANILRRYFNQLPEPIIPLDFYDRFRDPVRNQQAQATSEDGQVVTRESDPTAVIKVYQGLITELPPLNRQLLLYILDLLAVFASKADLNKMTTPNLAAIFQPGILSHPQHNMAPQEYRLSQDVLIFLIVNQDHFLIGMPGTAADQETVKDVQSGAASPNRNPAPASPGKAKLLRRSSSNASTGTESRWSNLRRNVSVSSRHSKQSGPGPTPLTPASNTPTNSGGVQRSNTVPSRRTASAAHSPLFARDKTPDTGPRIGETAVTTVEPAASSVQNTPVASTAATFPAAAAIEVVSASSSEATTPLAGGPLVSESSSTTTKEQQTPKRDTTPLLAPPGSGEPVSSERSVSGASGTSGRGFLNLLKQSPTAEGEGRKPNKLQKKRIPGSALSSAQSSSHDLGDEAEEVTISGVPIDQSLQRNPTVDTVRRPSSQQSARSHTSVTDQSDADMAGDDMPAHAHDAGEKPKKRRWRFSRSQNKLDSTASSNPLGTMSPRDQAMSKSTIGSMGRRESQDPIPLPPPSAGSAIHDGGHTSNNEQVVFSDSERERKGPVGWLRGKLQERKEKDAEKRAKTPERKTNAGRETSFEVLRHNTGHDSAEIANGQPPTIEEEPPTPATAVEAPATSVPITTAPVTKVTPSTGPDKFVENIDSATILPLTEPAPGVPSATEIAAEKKEEIAQTTGIVAAETKA